MINPPLADYVEKRKESRRCDDNPIYVDGAGFFECAAVIIAIELFIVFLVLIVRDLM